VYGSDFGRGVRFMEIPDDEGRDLFRNIDIYAVLHDVLFNKVEILITSAL
jgi:hypothetical protein